MTRTLRQLLSRSLDCAAICAALFVCAGAVRADDITIQSDSGALILTGRYIGYDGTYLQIETEYGPLTLNYAQVACDGIACPPRAAYVPDVRLSGARRMADVLIPALIADFARSNGYQATNTTVDATHLTVNLTDDDQPLANFLIRATNTDEGFADLVAHEADIVMSVREARRSEIEIAQEVGIGRLDDSRQSRIVGLDALVPIVSPLNKVPMIALSDLAAAFAGRIQNWAELGDADRPIVLHLLARHNGLSQRVVDDVVVAGGHIPTDKVIRHISIAALTAAVAADPGGLGIVPFGAGGDARAIALQDTCGFVVTPRQLTLKTEDYPLTAPLFLYLPQRRQPQIVRDFMVWLRTPAAQLVVRRSGFVDQGPLPIPLDAQGQRFANAITAAGPEVPLGELQRMVRILAPQTRLSVSFRFELGSTRLDAQSRSNLFDLAQAIRDRHYGGRVLMLVGFSDGRGGAAANRDLSSARAEAVRRALLALLGGTLPDDVEIETEAFGEALPMGCDDTEWGRQQNRRVELWVQDQSNP